jgi:hypothetical protein
MPWPPREGDLLPRFDEPEGIREKLQNYLLMPDHEDGGSKAKGFRDMLGIDADAADHLEVQIRGASLAPESPKCGEVDR